MKKDLVFENGVMFYCGIPVEQMLAYPLWLAARVAGCSHETISRAWLKGKLKRNEAGLYPRADLLRWLNEPGTPRPSRRKTRIPNEASPAAQKAKESPRNWLFELEEQRDFPPEEQLYIPGLEKSGLEKYFNNSLRSESRN